MKFASAAIIGVLCLISINVIGAETDQFTRRDEVLDDSATLLNSKANKTINDAINTVNAKDVGCVEKVLYKELRKYFANHVTGKLIKDILADPRINKRSIDLKESIYRDWTFWDGAGMASSLFAKTTMSGVMRVGDQTIGVDKFEHMFGQGFEYFTVNYLENKKEEKAFKGGIFREKFFLGGFKLGNGVFSYGDLSANFNGMRMWNHMLQRHEDILGADFNLGPYIACENNKWAQVKEIDFRNYIDDSMDEAINCSKFPTEKTAKKFENRLALMGVRCPIDPNRLNDMTIKYKHMSKWIINNEGTTKVNYFNRPN